MVAIAHSSSSAHATARPAPWSSSVVIAPPNTTFRRGSPTSRSWYGSHDGEAWPGLDDRDAQVLRVGRVARHALDAGTEERGERQLLVRAHRDSGRRMRTR